MRAALIISNCLMIASALFLYSEANGMRNFAVSTFNTAAILVAATACLAMWSLYRGQKSLSLVSALLIACSIGLIVRSQGLVPPPMY